MKTLLLSILLLSAGCTTTGKQHKTEKEYFFLPFPCDEFPNIARKSVTIEDYTDDYQDKEDHYKEQLWQL